MKEAVYIHGMAGAIATLIGLNKADLVHGLSPLLKLSGRTKGANIKSYAPGAPSRYDGATLRAIRAGTHPFHRQDRECARRRARGGVQ